MKKIFLSLILIIISLLPCCFACKNQFPNKINDTHFMNGGYLDYDLNSYKYNPKEDMYSIDVMEELDPGGDLGNIKCPYGEGYITHVIYLTKYSPKYKFFKAKYKGFMCSIGEYKYENAKPISFHYNYKGVYYDNNSSIITNFNMDYFDNLKKEINSPNEYNYFGFIKNVKEVKNTFSTEIDKKKYIIVCKTLAKIRNLDTYEPVPQELQDIYIKKIPEELLIDYRLDMNKALEHILNDKITYNGKTLRQMLLDFNNKSDIIYEKYLTNNKNKSLNKIYIEQLNEMNGTISLYPDTIIEEMQSIINKYNLNIEPGSEADTFLYKYYIKKYQIEYSKDIKELLELKEYTFTKINIYLSKISDEI